MCISLKQTPRLLPFSFQYDIVITKKHSKSLTTASKTLTRFYVSDLLFYNILLPQTHQSRPPSWPLNLLSLPEKLCPYLVIESRSHLLQVSTQMSPPERPPQTAYIKFSIFLPCFILLYCTCHSLTHWNIYFHMVFSLLEYTLHATSPDIDTQIIS